MIASHELVDIHLNNFRNASADGWANFLASEFAPVHYSRVSLFNAIQLQLNVANR